MAVSSIHLVFGQLSHAVDQAVLCVCMWGGGVICQAIVAEVKTLRVKSPDPGVPVLGQAPKLLL